MNQTGFSCVQKPPKVFARKCKHQVGAITSCDRGKNISKNKYEEELKEVIHLIKIQLKDLCCLQYKN